MQQEINELVEQDRGQLIECVVASVRIPSVKGEACLGKPFGVEVDRALEHALGVAEDLGFQVGRLDGYIGWVDYGRGDDLVGVLAHVDVVPPGKKQDWRYPPFKAAIQDGIMYGRGTADDKGPLFSVLFGLKAVRDARLPVSKRVRLLIGTGEESGWEGIQHYLNNEEVPGCGFSPDGLFAVVNREKGITVVKLRMPCGGESASTPRILSLHGGLAHNSVPDYAEALLAVRLGATNELHQALRELASEDANVGITFKAHGEGHVLVTSNGISAHAMSPEKGTNAIALLLRFLSRLSLAQDGATRFVRLLDEYIGMDYSGASLGMAWHDDPSGGLTLNLGTIAIDENNAEAVADIRSPVTIPCDDVVAQMKKAFEKTPLGIDTLTKKEPLYIPGQHRLIRTLSAVYEDVTGREAVLHSIGGGTYARAIENCICFGAIHPGEEITVHQPNERVSVDNLVLNAKIYGQALAELLR